MAREQRVPAAAVNAFVESTYAETWFDRNTVYESLEKLTALLVAIDEKPGTSSFAVHADAKDAEQYLEPLEEMGIHVHAQTEPAGTDLFREYYVQEYRDEIEDSVRVTTHMASPVHHDRDALEAVTSGEAGHRTAGEFYGFPDDCIDTFLADEGIGISTAQEKYGGEDEWYVRAFTQMILPDRQEAYERAKETAARRHDALQEIADRDDIEGVDEQLDILESYYREQDSTR